MRLASMPALDALIIPAKMTHNKNTPVNPAVKASAGRCGINKEITNATIAIDHQGKYSPAINEAAATIKMLKIKRISSGK